MPRVQFSLRLLLAIVTALAVALSLWSWVKTRHMRELADVISASDLESEDKRLLTALAWNEHAWESGLLQNIFAAPVMKRIAWQGAFSDERGETFNIFVLDAFARPTADMPIPPVCVVTDRQLALLHWASVAEFSQGVFRVNLTRRRTENLLTISTSANWFHGLGTYEFIVTREAIVERKKAMFRRYTDKESREPPPKLLPDPKKIDEARAATRSSILSKERGRWGAQRIGHSCAAV